MQLQGVLTVLLCNVKACKLRGVASKARLLVCSASDDDVTERLVPPTGSDPGDRVTFLNYPGNVTETIVNKLNIMQLFICTAKSDIGADGIPM